MNDFVLSSTTLDETQNHDDFVVVWLSSDHTYPNDLNHFFVDYVNKFDSSEDFDNYIKEIETSFFDRLSDFNGLPQIKSIYILERNSQSVKYEKQTYPKVVNVYTDERIIIKRLRQDIVLTYRNDLPIILEYKNNLPKTILNNIKGEQSLTSFDQNTTLFLWNQLFIYCLVHFTDISMDKLKEDMVEQCRLERKNNKAQLDKINDFGRTCTFDNILEWYTSDSCVFGLVNKAFRTRNIDLICKFRYFITLLHNKLEKLARQQQQNPLTIYRAQNMKKNELNMLKKNKGSLISTNSIMSTTRNPNVARIFLDEKAEVNVIFEIHISSESNNIISPFADISQFSSKADEEETLFFPGAVFRIDSVELENGSTWIIKLTSTNETVEETRQLLNNFEQQIASAKYYGNLSKNTDDYSLFNKYHKYLTDRYSMDDIPKMAQLNVPHLMRISGNYEQSIEYYKQLLKNKQFIDEPKFLVLNIIIGYNYFRLSQYDNALDYYTDILPLLNDQSRLAASLYNHIGNVWKKTNYFENALLYYKKALDILNNHFDKDKGKDTAVIYRNITDVYLKQNNDEEAMHYTEQASEMDKYCEQTHRFLDNETLLQQNRNQLYIESDLQLLRYADVLYQNGIRSIKESDFFQALENFSKAEELFLKHLSLYDYVVHRLAKLYQYAAFAHLCLNDKFKALDMWKRAININANYNYLLY